MQMAGVPEPTTSACVQATTLQLPKVRQKSGVAGIDMFTMLNMFI